MVDTLVVVEDVPMETANQTTTQSQDSFRPIVFESRPQKHRYHAVAILSKMGVEPIILKADWSGVYFSG